MQTHAQRMRDIVKQDNARRADRVIKELALFDRPTDAPDGIDPYLWDRSITGVPSAGNRNPKASRNSWLQGRVVGVATGTENTHKPGDPATVLIRKPGLPDEVVTVASFRPARDTRAVVRVKRETATPETALHTPKLTHDYTS